MTEAVATAAAAPRERPILFSGTLVRAILAGKKSVTRRVVKNPGRLNGLMLAGEEPEWCPYGKPGDRLWVRETWYCDDIFAGDHVKACAACVRCKHTDADRIRQWQRELYYRADAVKTGTCCELIPECCCEGRSPWRPSIFMPRWASRITLEVTAVRVERLQEITDAEVLAEGIEPSGPRPGCARNAFSRKWDELHGAGSWDRNPWVWVIGFRRVDGR